MGFSIAADSERIIRRSGTIIDDIVFPNDITVLLGIAARVANVPVEKLKKLVDKVGSRVRFVVKKLLYCS